MTRSSLVSDSEGDFSPRDARVDGLAQVGGGFWEWDVRSGVVSWEGQVHDEVVHAALGTAGRSALEDVHPDDRTRLEDAVARSLRTGSLSIGYRVARGHHEGWRYIQAYGVVVRDGSGDPAKHRGFAFERRDEGVHDDLVTEEKRAAQLGYMTAGTIHDLNNLLQILIGNLDRAIREDDVEQREEILADEVMAAARRGAVLLERLLDFFQARTPQSGADEGGGVSCPPHDVIRGIEPLLKLLFRPLRAELVLDLPATRDASIHATDLEQIVFNLALNARSALRPGGTVAVRICEDDENIAVCIEDSGDHSSPGSIVPGSIPPTEVETVGGRGLGLKIVRGLLRRSDGVLEQDRSELGGRRYCVVLDALP